MLRLILTAAGTQEDDKTKSIITISLNDLLPHQVRLAARQISLSPKLFRSSVCRLCTFRLLCVTANAGYTTSKAHARALHTLRSLIHAYTHTSPDYQTNRNGSGQLLCPMTSSVQH
ncbi:hypothetical protein BaRGS_00033594 [Batillaria attramentaria]|uniref:Uncharacterized protein n=1 Tax=Batillaria attramentaria TaxID=370345 RepID=A0ABD0JJM8_9CAEN